MIFSPRGSGGEDGEQILRRIVEGGLRFLPPAGRF